MSIDECTAMKAASPSSKVESRSDSSNVYESMLPPSNDDAKKNEVHVKGIEDLLEILTASAMYARMQVYLFTKRT